MALYAFDGTGNKDRPEDERDSNVLKFFQIYEAGHVPIEGAQCLYLSGVGTRKGIIGRIFGSLFGAGGHRRVRDAKAILAANFAAGDRVIDVVGFSRGAAIALEFVNEINKNEAGLTGDRGQGPPRVRFLGLWDAVASFGLPGNAVNIGFDLSVPANVDNTYHAISLDERRDTFPLNRLVKDANKDRIEKNITEVWFRGYHSDVGGGNSNVALSSITLNWMGRRGVAHGLPLAESLLEPHHAQMNPSVVAQIPKIDKVADGRRRVLATDLIHESVVFRLARLGEEFVPNNPPEEAFVMGDDGEVRDFTFGDAELS